MVLRVDASDRLAGAILLLRRSLWTVSDDLSGWASYYGENVRPAIQADLVFTKQTLKQLHFDMPGEVLTDNEMSQALILLSPAH